MQTTGTLRQPKLFPSTTGATILISQTDFCALVIIAHSHTLYFESMVIGLQEMAHLVSTNAQGWIV